MATGPFVNDYFFGDDITLYDRGIYEMEHIGSLDRALDVAHNDGILAIHLSLYDPRFAKNDLFFTIDIPDQFTVHAHAFCRPELSLDFGTLRHHAIQAAVARLFAAAAGVAPG